MLNITDFVYVFLLFIPGSLLLSFLSFHFDLRFTKSEQVTLGAILWFSTFSFVSLIIGIYTSAEQAWFLVFPYLSCGLIFAVLIGFILTYPKIRASFRMPKAIGIGTIVIIVFAILSFFLVNYHSLLTEWDVIYRYIPLSRDILLSGGLNSQPYHFLNFFDQSPLFPISYAYLLEFSDTYSLYLLSFCLFLLTFNAFYLLSREFFDKSTAVLSTLIFVSLPTTLLVMSSRALYLDVGFLLFCITALYLLIKIFDTNVRGKNSVFCSILFSCAFSIMILARIEFGALLAFAFIACIIAYLKLPFWKILSVLFVCAPYAIREIRNLIITPYLWQSILLRLIPTIVLSIGLFVFLLLGAKKIERKKFFDNLRITIKIKSFNLSGSVSRFGVFLCVTFLGVLAALTFVVKNLFLNGFLLPDWPTSNTQVLAASAFFKKMSPVSSSVETYTLMNWQNLFSNWWLIAPLLVPFLIGSGALFYDLCKRRKIELKHIFVVFIFVAFFAIWAQLSCDPQPRKLYYFVPFVSLIATYGFFSIRRLFTSLGFVLRVLAFITINTYFVFLLKGVNSIESLAAQYFYTSQWDPTLLAASCTLFVILFIPYEKIAQHFLKNTKNFTSIVITAFFLLFILVFSLFSYPIISEVVRGNLPSDSSATGWYYYPQVVDYYAENITDHRASIGFYCHELVTFANRTIIDLSDPVYGSALYSWLQNATVDELSSFCAQKNIGYFLEPTKSNSFYNIYLNLLNESAAFYQFIRSPNLVLIQTFTYANLYRLNFNYSEEPLTFKSAEPWNFNSSKNYTIVSQENTFEFNAVPDTRLGVLIIPNSPEVPDYLLINLEWNGSVTLNVILFSDLNDRQSSYLSSSSIITNMGSIVINTHNSLSVGNFSADHVEGMLLSVLTNSTISETLKASLFSITYP